MLRASRHGTYFSLQRNYYRGTNDTPQLTSQYVIRQESEATEIRLPRIRLREKQPPADIVSHSGNWVLRPFHPRCCQSNENYTSIPL